MSYHSLKRSLLVLPIHVHVLGVNLKKIWRRYCQMNGIKWYPIFVRGLQEVVVGVYLRVLQFLQHVVLGCHHQGLSVHHRGTHDGLPVKSHSWKHWGRLGISWHGTPQATPLKTPWLFPDLPMFSPDLKTLCYYMNGPDYQFKQNYIKLRGGRVDGMPPSAACLNTAWSYTV